MADTESSDADPDPAARALANDGQWYSFKEFLDEYGRRRGRWMWDTARAWTHEATPAEWLAKGEAEPEVRDVRGSAAGSAAKPVADPAELVASVAEVAAAGPAQPAAASASVVQLLPIFTIHDLSRVTAHISGKRACAEQRRLRQIAMASDTPYDPLPLENTSFNWRAVLKSLPTAEAIIGCGVTAFNFRLLPGVMDHNYVKVDSGERHVFEVVRADGSTVLLHFHKNGKCDPPEVLPPEDMAPSCAATSEPAGVAYTCQPAVQYRDIVNLVAAGDKSAPLGRSETLIALQSLLIAGFGKSNVGALNLTDGVAFPWTRFLKNNVLCKEYVGPGIERVYAARFHEDAAPVLVICRADGSYVELEPSKNGDRHTMHNNAGDAWQEMEALQQAQYIGVSWMHVRASITL